MSNESLDDEVARLFEACRAERPSDSVRRAVLVKARRAAPRRAGAISVGLLLLAASAVLAVGLGFRRKPAPRIDAERLAASSPDHGSKAALTARPEPRQETGPAPSATTRAKPPLKVQLPRPAPLTLEEETKVLENVRARLRAGDSTAALAELSTYRRTAPGGALALEATLLEIQALSAAGRTSEASALAERFIHANPNSPLVDRARRFLGRPAARGSEPTPSAVVESTGSDERSKP